jgi:cell division protein FtsB
MNNQINLIDMIQEVKVENLTIRTEVINREIYSEELEIKKLKDENNYLTERTEELEDTIGEMYKYIKELEQSNR